MEYITSRGFELPTGKEEMERLDWFNMWKKRLFPYSELLVGDTLYWFDTTKQKIVWKTQVTWVVRGPYSDKNEVFELFPESKGEGYRESRAEKGYYVGYKIKVIEKLNIDKPYGFGFPAKGWLKVNSEIASNWLKKTELEDSNVLDDNISNGKKPIGELLAELNEKMKDVSPERVERLVATTIRKDTRIVNALKKAAEYKCQFPNCGHRIKKKSGGYYIEVAHVKPVHEGGKSVLGNLLVLCPNHHKEFDYGDLERIEQTATKLVGNLNGKGFQIEIQESKK